MIKGSTEALMQHDNDLMGAVSECWQLRLQLEIFFFSLSHHFPIYSIKPALLAFSSAYVRGSFCHSLAVISGGSRGRERSGVLSPARGQRMRRRGCKSVRLRWG